MENTRMNKVGMINTSRVLKARTFTNATSEYFATQNCWVQVVIKTANKLGRNASINDVQVVSLYTEGDYIESVSCYPLKKYLLSRKDANLALFVSSKSPYLRLSEHGVRQMLQRLGLRAGVEKVHPHRYRATAATNALNRGMPIQDVQALLGHENISTTMIYCTVARDNVRAAHKRYLSA